MLTLPCSYSYVPDVPPDALVYRDPSAPRWLPSTVARRRRTPPPPPSVEDEVQSLAREHRSGGDHRAADDVPSRGDLDQWPLILDVHEHNPERRFVLTSTNSSEAEAGQPEKIPEKVPEKTSENKRNSTDKDNFHPARPSDRGTPPKVVDEPRPEVPRHSEPEKKSSHQHTPPSDRLPRRDNVPPIATDVAPEPPVHQTPRPQSSAGPKTEPSRYPAARDKDDSNLSPSVARSTAKSRDRTERRYDESSDRASDRRYRQDDDAYARRGPRGPRTRDDSTSESLRPALPVHPTLEKRPSMVEIPKSRPQSAVRESPERKPKVPERPMTASHVKRASRDSSYERVSEPRSERDKLSPRDLDTSEDDSRRRLDSRRRQKPIIVDERVDRSEFVGPRPETRPPVEKGRYRARDVPGHSSRPSQSQLFDPEPIGPRSSTFPREQKSSDDERRPPPPPARASTTRSAIGQAASVAIPAIIAAATAASANSGRDNGTPSDRRYPSAVPPPPPQHKSAGSARSSSSTLSSSPPKQTYQPPKFDPMLINPVIEKPASYHRRLSEDVRSGELPDIADCPRTIETAGHMDWLTLPKSDNFNICPTCYQNVFANTEFATHFTLAPFRPVTRPIKCDFGTSQWYHIAWLLILKYRKADMTLLHNIASIGANNQPCTGFRETYRKWYSIRDPSSQRAISSFRVCGHCAQTIAVLLPNLSGVFVDSSGDSSAGVCLMHPSPERRRFVLYFDIMETASDRALATKTAPDIRRLASKIRELSRVPECRGYLPVKDGRWYVMKKLPNFTVCEECFEDVIEPVLERGQALSFVGNFHSDPVQLQLGACQLYSHRMRDIFGKAMRRKDFDYLEDKLYERQGKEQEMYTRLKSLDRHALGADYADREVARIMDEWKKWE